MNPSKDDFSSPTKVSSQQKNARTDEEAKKIMAAEVIARQKKTAKLRNLRLQQAATQVEEVALPKKKKK